MSDADAAPKRGPKCAQVLEGARKVFMDRGYEGASVDEIARVAGTSKATLYSYFPDKRQLFEAVMQTQCGRTGRSSTRRPTDEPVEVTLRRMAARFATFLFSPGAQEMFRVCIAEAGRFPELGAAFHASGPARAHARPGRLLRRRAAPGASSPSTTPRPPPSSSPPSARPGSSCARCSAARPPDRRRSSASPTRRCAPSSRYGKAGTAPPQAASGRAADTPGPGRPSGQPDQIDLRYSIRSPFSWSVRSRPR